MNKVIIGAAMLLAATGASAVTFTTAAGPFDPGAAPSEHVIVDFEAPTAGVTYAGSYTIDAGNVSGVRAPPANDTTKYFATPGESDTSSSGSATIDFSGYVAGHGELRTLSFYWGSVDSYNTLQIFGTGTEPIFSMSGDQIFTPANGNQSSPSTNQRVYFTFAPGDNFRSLQLSSGARAFEIDDIAASVPEPTTWATLVLGLGLVGTAMRRTRRTPTVTG